MVLSPDMKLEHKSLVAEVVDADSGSARLRIAQFDVIDKDNDVTIKGFFGTQPVTVLPAHDWGHVPLGKGSTLEDDQHAYADVKFNMDVPAARDWHSAIKFDLAHPPSIQEYSYGYEVVEGGSHHGDFKGTEVRFLHAKEDGSPGANIREISPVVVGAGVNTGTVSAKGRTFTAELDETLAVLESTLKRAKALAALREADGRQLSNGIKTKLEELAEMSVDLFGLVAAPVDEALAELARFELQRHTSLTHKE